MGVPPYENVWEILSWEDLAAWAQREGLKTQRALAQRLGVTDGQLSQWKNGWAKPSLKRQERMANLIRGQFDAFLASLPPDDELPDDDEFALSDEEVAIIMRAYARGLDEPATITEDEETGEFDLPDDLAAIIAYYEQLKFNLAFMRSAKAMPFAIGWRAETSEPVFSVSREDAEDALPTVVEVLARIRLPEPEDKVELAVEQLACVDLTPEEPLPGHLLY